MSTELSNTLIFFYQLSSGSAVHRPTQKQEAQTMQRASH